MKDLSTADLMVGDIGMLLDRALADPARAPIVRAAMRARLARAAAEEPLGDEADAEDLWDNVPV
jgi:hypothetical protein